MKRFNPPIPFQPFVQIALFIVFAISVSPGLHAQTATDAVKPGETLQPRIERARALIAAHQLRTAASELESVRAATQDYAIRNIASVMLMSVYLEEANYARAEALLEENFQFRSTRNDDCVRNYFALAGQAVNGARNHLARYRNVGINTTDPNLAAEALNDLNRLRSLLERMIAQAREISKDRKAYDSLSLLEDVLGIRLLLATDREDQAKWESEYSGARELLASSLTEVASLGGIPMIPLTKTPLTIVSTANPTKPVPETQAPEKQDSRDSAESQKPNDLKPLETGLLNAKATKRVLPSYPNLAKLSGATGLVRVYVVVDENGKVAEVSRSEGPLLLRQAAEEAARQWFFVAILSNGKPARVSGYIDFNFMP